MKPRRVIVTIEMTTSAPIKEIKKDYADNYLDIIHQIQVNVVKADAKKKKK